MRDVFYIILVVWIITRVVGSLSSYKSKGASDNQSKRKEGETKVDYIPPTKKTNLDKAGEYVDYEEVKEK